MIATLPTLDLAIATHRPEGIRRVSKMVLPAAAGVRYIVSWQGHEGAEIPRELLREDVEVYRFDDAGQSGNRNNALARCRGDIVLMSDDDLEYTSERLQAVREAFRDNAEADLITFRSEHADPGRFPADATDLGRRLPKGYSVACFEIAVRRERLGGLHFCAELGLASPELHGGEDEAFVYAAILRGLRCRFVPVTICAHPHVSTGYRARLTPQNQMAQGAMVRLMNPLNWPVRVVLKGWRLWRSGRATAAEAMINPLRGALKLPGVKRRNPDTLG